MRVEGEGRIRGTKQEWGLERKEENTWVNGNGERSNKRGRISEGKKEG